MLLLMVRCLLRLELLRLRLLWLLVLMLLLVLLLCWWMPTHARKHSLKFCCFGFLISNREFHVLLPKAICRPRKFIKAVIKVICLVRTWEPPWFGMLRKI